MFEREINEVTVQLVKGDIASQGDISAIVNAANARLQTGGGVAGAIHRAAGPGLTEEARPLAPIKPGESVITGGHDLPNDYVIHTLGPIYGSDRPEAELLANCYRSSLEVAEENRITSIAFPAISTGAFGYPLEDATDVALRTVLETTSSLDCVKLIRFVLFSERELVVHENKLSQLLWE
ncbi:MAG: macro domain-containing protein [Rubrobacteraceae bacterium]